MEKPAKNDILELEIQDLGFEGKGIARTSGDFVVFVNNAVPGDKVKAKQNNPRMQLFYHVQRMQNAEYRL